MNAIPHRVDFSVKPDVAVFFDAPANTISSVVKDPASTDAIIAHIKARGLRLEWLIETHVHADHLSAAPYIQQQIGDRIGIGEQITVVQELFGKVFNEGTELRRDGSQFDRLFKAGDTTAPKP